MKGDVREMANAKNTVHLWTHTDGRYGMTWVSTCGHIEVEGMVYPVAASDKRCGRCFPKKPLPESDHQ